MLEFIERLAVGGGGFYSSIKHDYKGKNGGGGGCVCGERGGVKAMKIPFSGRVIPFHQCPLRPSLMFN